MLLKLLLLAFVSSVCGEVVIQVSSIRSKKVKFMGNELSSDGPADRLTMSFVKNGLLIQTNSDSVFFNYEKKFLEWTEFKTKTEQTLQKISFNDLNSKGFSNINFLSATESFFQKAKPKIKKRNVVVGEWKLNKWKWKYKASTGKKTFICWTVDQPEKVEEIKHAINLLIDECGALPNIYGMDDWFRILLSTNELPMFIQENTKKKYLFTKVDVENYFAVRRIEEKIGLTPLDMMGLAESKSWISRSFTAFLSLFMDIGPIVAIVGIIFVFSSFFWGPSVSDAFWSRRDSKYVAKIKHRDDIMRVYNVLIYLKSRTLKTGLNQSELIERSNPIKNVIDTSRAIKKVFKKKEKEKLLKILNEFTLENKRIYEQDIDALLKKCDKFI